MKRQKKWPILTGQKGWENVNEYRILGMNEQLSILRIDLKES